MASSLWSNGRVRLRDLDGPVFTNPRLGPSITFLRESVSLTRMALQKPAPPASGVRHETL